MMSPFPPVPDAVVCSVTFVPAFKLAAMVLAVVWSMVRSLGSSSQAPPAPASMKAEPMLTVEPEVSICPPAPFSPRAEIVPPRVTVPPSAISITLPPPAATLVALMIPPVLPARA